MFPPNYTRVLKEDLGKDVPAWTDKILYQLNLISDYLRIAFTKGISVQDNLINPIKQMTILATGVPKTDTLNFAVALPSGQQPIGVVILNCIDNSGALVGAPVWAEMQPGLSNGNITIRAIYGLTSGHSYTVTFLVF
jgi:hypothetical protein